MAEAVQQNNQVVVNVRIYHLQRQWSENESDASKSEVHVQANAIDQVSINPPNIEVKMDRSNKTSLYSWRSSCVDFSGFEPPPQSPAGGPDESLHKHFSSIQLSKREDNCADTQRRSLKLEDDVRLRKILKLQDKLTRIADNHKTAEPILEELTALEGYQNLDTILAMIECLIYLGKHPKAGKVIRKVKSLLMKSGENDLKKIMSLAENLRECCFHVRSIILLRIAGGMYVSLQSKSPDDAVNGIERCVSQIYESTRQMIKTRGHRNKNIAINYGIEYMLEMLDDLKKIENADIENKALSEGLCCQCIGFCYNRAEEHNRSIKIWKSGVRALEKQLDPESSQYRVYGYLLHNIGVGYFIRKKFLKAEPYFVKALDSIKKSSGYSSEQQRETDIELTTTGLEDTRKKISVSA